MNWIVCSILTALLWAICYTSVEQVVKVIDKRTYIVIYSFFVLAVYLAIGWHKMPEDLVKLQNNTDNVSVWTLFAVLASIAGSYLSILAIETSNASLAASLEITYPFWCMLLAFLLFGHTMSITSIFGVILIFAGVVTVVLGKN